MTDDDFYRQAANAVVTHSFHPIAIEATVKRNRIAKKNKRYYERHKDEPEFKARRKEANHKFRDTDEYRKAHAEEMRIWRSKQSPEWKKKEIERLLKYLRRI